MQEFFACPLTTSCYEQYALKKNNLLLYLAKVDDHFAESEKSLLLDILRENGLEESYLHEHRQEIVDLQELKNLPGKTELLFWALKLIHADHQLHPAEIFYCKVIAHQLGFKPEVIGFFSTNPLTTLEEFEHQVRAYQIQSA